MNDESCGQSTAANAGDRTSENIPSDPSRATVSWDEARLRKLIDDRVEESLTLDYKRAAALDAVTTDKVTKAVSAMANSAGGTLIYGIAEFNDDARKYLPERIDPVNRNRCSRERLEEMIGRIQPRIQAITIHCVQLSSGATDVAYVVEIPQSTTAHQATDKKYYKRFNFESVAMYDYEIRDIMGRRSHPTIALTAHVVLYSYPTGDGLHGSLIIKLHNRSDVLAQHYAVTMNLPLQLTGKYTVYEDAELQTTNEGTSGTLSFSNARGTPLFPRSSGTRRIGFRFASYVSNPPTKYLNELRYVIFADEMPKVKGAISIESLLEPPE